MIFFISIHNGQKEESIDNGMVSPPRSTQQFSGSCRPMLMGREMVLKTNEMENNSIFGTE